MALDNIGKGRKLAIAMRYVTDQTLCGPGGFHIMSEKKIFKSANFLTDIRV